VSRRVTTTVNQGAVNSFATSRPMRQMLDGIAFTVTAHAVPYSGVDTGRLIGSMTHTVTETDGQLVAYLGSGVGDGTTPVYYWAYHWAGRPAPDQDSLAKPGPGETLPSRPHPTKPSPTRPYKSAMDDLNVTYTVNPGGFES
jgi:hypothetical protein